MWTPAPFTVLLPTPLSINVAASLPPLGRLSTRRPTEAGMLPLLPISPVCVTAASLACISASLFLQLSPAVLLFSLLFISSPGLFLSPPGSLYPFSPRLGLHVSGCISPASILELPVFAYVSVTIALSPQCSPVPLTRRRFSSLPPSVSCSLCLLMSLTSSSPSFSGLLRPWLVLSYHCLHCCGSPPGCEAPARPPCAPDPSTGP